MDRTSESGIAYATIFLTGTTVGVSADEQGYFSVQIPEGSYEVLVRMLGYNFKKVSVWMRNPAKMEEFVASLKDQGIPAEAVTDLEESARNADLIACATPSKTPIIKGEWIQSGTHLDLMGSYKPDTRETDDEAIRKSAIFVDSRAGALHESGELALPIAVGIITANDVKADLVELIKGNHPGRTSSEEVTLFKSVGLAIEDLAAALLVYKSYNSNKA